jgi:hypothetical protein
MNFLQPWLLAALPLMALPVVIHLINQRRFQTVPWGAMMFLLTANRMARGYARVRQWLILLFRTLAIAALVFAISRPLSSGWLGAAAGGGSETTIVLVDRSPSMEQRSPGLNVSKRQAALLQLDSTLQTLGPERLVVIDSGGGGAREIESRQVASGTALSSSLGLAGTSATADIPGMLLEAFDFIRDNKLGQTDIWICSDLQSTDWQPADGRWQTIRDSYRDLPTRVRFSLLAFTERPESNAAVRVTDVRRLPGDTMAEILVSLELQVSGTAASQSSLPIEIVVDGARTTIEATPVDGAVEVNDYRVPIPRDTTQGWGRVSIPADANTADNVDYFVFDDPPPRRTLVVSDDPAVRRVLELAGGIAPVEGLRVESIAFSPDQLEAVVWDELCLLLWHGPLPRGETAAEIQRLVQRGGRVMFFPSAQPDDTTMFGIGYADYRELREPLSVESWRGDSDLLANTQSGASLPVGQLQVTRYAPMRGSATALATLGSDEALLVRAATNGGGAYFWSTVPQSNDSTLATAGVVLYVAIQRAADRGAEALRGTGNLIAGTSPADTAIAWERLAGDEEKLSTESWLHAGVYRAGDNLLAINRSPREDDPLGVEDQAVASLFQGLDFQRITVSAGSLDGLVQEVWRLFLVSMMVSMLVEAALCLPKTSAMGSAR